VPFRSALEGSRIAPVANPTRGMVQSDRHVPAHIIEPFAIGLCADISACTLAPALSPPLNQHTLAGVRTGTGIALQ